MKKTQLLIIATLLLFAHTVVAEDSVTDKSTSKNINANMQNADVNIGFYNRTMYYPGNSEDNPIYIHVSVSNKGSETLRFKLADDRVFSIDFIAYTVKNNIQPQTDNLIRKRSTNQTVYFREISLEPGEEYSFIENVKNYLAIDDPSIYYLELRFYPELYKTKENVISSNRLSLEVRPSPTAASSTIIPVEQGTASLLQTEQISPDRVVEQTIIARQRNLWDQYFLYMDVEEMLKRDPVRLRKYNNMGADDRSEMLQSFKVELMQNRIDNDIVAIPSKFSIDTTNYSQTEGTVTVYEWFKNDTYTEKKRYTYFVRQRDGIWLIYDYSVENLESE
ncbi:MAG: hypothetical protein WCQ67_08970 [Treponema sp.]